MSAPRQQRTRQAKTKATQEINRIFHEESINDKEYYHNIKAAAEKPVVAVIPKIKLKECKALYEKDGIDAILPFKLTDERRGIILDDIERLIESIFHGIDAFNRYCSRLVPTQKQETIDFYSKYDKKSLNFIYQILDEERLDSY